MIISTQKTRQQEQIEMHARISKHYKFRYSPEYSRLFQKYWNQTMIAQLPADQNLTILDLGCGTGILLEDLDQLSAKIFGIDISVDMLKQVDCKLRSSRQISVADGLSLPFHDGQFDAVFCRGALHHIPSLEGALKEIHRVLKSGGKIILSEPSNESPVIRFMRKFMYRRSNKFHENDIAYIPRDLYNSLYRCGFKIGRKRHFGYLAYTLAGFPDHLGVLRFLPGNVWITHILIYLDRMMSHIPIWRSMSLHIMITAHKAGVY